MPRACRTSRLYYLNIGCNQREIAASDEACSSFAIENLDELEPDSCIPAGDQKTLSAREGTSFPVNGGLPGNNWVKISPLVS